MVIDPGITDFGYEADEDEEEFDPMAVAMAEASRQAAQANRGGERYTPPSKPKPTAKPATAPKQPKPTAPTTPSPVAGKRARDGQTFAQQSRWTQDAFRFQYASMAEDEWIKQHEAELDKNLKNYGVQEPKAGAAPVVGVTGVGPAPNRTIGAAAPPPTGSASTTVAPQPGTTPAVAPTPAGGWFKPPEQGFLPYESQDMVYVTNKDRSKNWTMTAQEYERRYYAEPGEFAESRVEYFQPYGQQKWYLSGSNKEYVESAVSTAARPATPPTPSTAPPTTPPAGSAPGAPDAPSNLGRGSTVPGAGAAAPAQPVPVSSSAPLSPEDDIVIRNPKLTGQPQYTVKRKHFGPGQPFGGPTYTPEGGWELVSDPVAAVAPPTSPPVADASQPQSVKMSQTTAQVLDDLPDPSKPIDSIIIKAGQRPEDAQRVIQGIGALLKGDTSGAWTEPYLNDTARFAWAAQERANGRNVDPLDAPGEYIESWKDAFLGSDHSVPLVKELDQQLIDAAVDRTPAGQPFRWKEAYGETGENGLISRQVASNDCGPNTYANILRSQGYNANPADTFEQAKAKGYHDGEQFSGPYGMVRMLKNEAGLDASAHPVDWAFVDQELAEGRVVGLSSGGHWWTVSAKRDGPNGPEYYTGATGSVVGNPEWSTAGGIRHGGAPSHMVVIRGQVDPNAPGIQAMGLRPPASGPDRALLSAGTRQRATQRIGTEMRQQVATQAAPGSDEQLIWNIATEEGLDDPVLALAVMGQESGGDQGAVSPVGALGKMQLMPATARELGVDPNDPVDNIRGGIRYLKRMLDKYNGNRELALAAYNAGPGAVDAAGGIPDYAETRAYVPAVQGRYKSLLDRYNQPAQGRR